MSSSVILTEKDQQYCCGKLITIKRVRDFEKGETFTFIKCEVCKQYSIENIDVEQPS